MLQQRNAGGLKGRNRIKADRVNKESRRKKRLILEALEARQLLAFNIVDDSFSLASDTSLNVLSNDVLGTETQAVSAMNVEYDRATVRTLGNNYADNYIPDDRSDNSGLHQRSIYTGAMTLLPTQNNYGDIDLYVDNDSDPANDTGGILRFTRQDGVVLGTLMSNDPLNEAPIPQPGGADIAVRANLGVIQFTSGSPTLPNANPNMWIATNAAPENNGERAVDFSAAMFRYSDGWVAGTFNGTTQLAGSTDVSVIGSDGQYEVSVNGVTDSFEDGYLFVIAGENDNTYARALPAGGDKWNVVLRTNSQGFSESEPRGGRQRFSALYVPRAATGLIGGTVRGGTPAANPMAMSFGDFDIQRVEDGLWRLAVPGHDQTSGMVLMESADSSPDRPSNAYFTYDADPDNAGAILLRQFNYDAPDAVPSNNDFTFLFVPFENNVLPERAGISITRLGPDASSLVDVAASPLSTAGIALGVNADGTIDYQTGDAIRSLPEGSSNTDSFVYEVQFFDNFGTLVTETATVSINWVGVNDRPDLVGEIGVISRSVGQAAFTLDLDTIFEDIDTGDSLSFVAAIDDAAIASATVSGSTLSVTGVAVGTTQLTVTATDQGGLSRTVTTGVRVSSLMIVDDIFSISSDTVLAPLNNDRIGTEVQNVSAMNVVYNRDTVRSLGNNYAENTVPSPRTNDAGLPQRTVEVGAMTLKPNQNNYADISLYFDLDDDPTNDTTNIARMNKANGIVLGTMMDNSPLGPGQHGPTAFRANSNLAVVQYTSNDGGDAWIATNAAPENNGERAIDFSSAFFPYNAGWRGGSFNFAGNATSANRSSITWGGDGLTVTELSTGRYEVEVDGVTDSFNEGFLFAIGGDNSDNYTRTRPIGGSKWVVQHRDNAAGLDSSEGNSWNVVYIPRSAPGLVGGVVNGSSDVANPMRQTYGDFNVQREEDGFWRLSVPGHNSTSGVVVMETMDLSVDVPRNSYFSYVAANDNPDDIMIRQFDYTRGPSTLNPQNGDFAFFFIPFENEMQSSTPIEVTSLGSSLATLGDNLTSKGFPISINSDGTINYDTNDAIRALGEGETDVDTFVYEASFGGETQTALVTINWVGANDAPEIIQEIGELDLLEDSSAAPIDLETIFFDPDAGDELTYTVDFSRDDILDATLTGTNLVFSGQSDKFGFVVATVTATDLSGASVSVTVPISVLAQADGPVAVDDAVNGLASAVLTLDLLANDFHPDAGPYQVVGANIFGNAEAANDAETNWVIEQTGVSPNVMTMIGDQNRGDLAIGVEGTPATPRDGVLMGTIRNDAAPFGSVNVWSWAARGDAMTFATELGAGGNGERNAPLGAALFPFAEGWVGGHVATDGTLLEGNGVNQSNIAKVPNTNGLWTVSIPGVTNSATDGFLFVIGGNNDDNFTNALPLGGDSWLIRQIDNDSAPLGFENDPFRFVYVPINSPDLIAGRWLVPEQPEDEEQGPIPGSIDLSSGTFTATDLDDGLGTVALEIPGVTPQDGALIVVPAGSQTITLPDASTAEIPPNLHGFYEAEVDGSGVETGRFLLKLRQSVDFEQVNDTLKFMFIPFETPLRTALSENTGIEIDTLPATTPLGATITDNGDGTISIDPSTSPELSALEPGQSQVESFSYTIVDGSGNTSTATAEVTFFGSNLIDISLSNDQVIENTDTSMEDLLVGELIAGFIVDDPLETFTYELVAGAGDEDNGSFVIVDDQLFLAQGTEIDFETKPEYLLRVKVTTGSSDTLEQELSVNVVDLLEVSEIVVNEGSAQRSRVASVDVEFDGEVLLDAGAFEVSRRGSGGGSVAFEVSTVVVDGRTVATLSFVDNTNDFIQAGSLVDGNYQLRIDGTKVSRPDGELLDADQNGTGGGELLFGEDEADDFFRFFGDVNGDRAVNFVDFLQFRGAFGSTESDPEYREEFDVNADGNVNFVDFLQFRSRFGSMLDFE